MKPFYLLFCIAITSSVFAQKLQYNTNKGYVAEGYDLVSYFQQKAEKGDKKFTTTYDGVQFKFAPKAHLEAFEKTCRLRPFGGSGDKYVIGPTF